ncbi:3'(2'),5'-bisphosphate nucleotidase CysQ [Methylobacterium sp. NEAU 140]|uniref:3'(2'),5'-bisphosphate nucleotidase CysQ family protein n=1 Tax=Methylobacterium sp. NEAU 140 TaxID=3064945 RepID=UPI0027329E9C|nr:3'(2'),5'-bisphosphate nucleotidase CysQ [Methylobacterium sp. NEAU 140]MDP4024135.1 3'(2'),5'-bisphosphate nucleotidase CysQ [Methylobacterium sp. NEAU 140]
MTGAAAFSEAERGAVAAALAEIACAAGEILRRYHRGPCPHALKPDGSPSSAADLEAEHLILGALAGRFPGLAVVAEETRHDAPASACFFLVDPLDGTRDFLAGTPDYSVNIALIAGDRPVAAALAAPGIGRVWWAGAAAVEAAVTGGRPGPGRAVRARAAPTAGLVALGSRRHGDPETATCLAALPVAETRAVGSALKFGLIAAGEADVYVRCGPTMEWDTAAGDHLVAAAGGCVVAPGGGPIRYGRFAEGYRNGPFAALGDPGLAGRLALPKRRPASAPAGVLAGGAVRAAESPPAKP